MFDSASAAAAAAAAVAATSASVSTPAALPSASVAVTPTSVNNLNVHTFAGHRSAKYLSDYKQIVLELSNEYFLSYFFFIVILLILTDYFNFKELKILMSFGTQRTEQRQSYDSYKKSSIVILKFYYYKLAYIVNLI
jgi:hypothetical protein